ncbi:hypothetical protein [Chitinimonas lacunae]|uniref:Uncharacterized protein n=1 Tax=Chitinimonas lacunae TaxID=1963018 RepID=A0ABV8MKF9_9NEIS
MTLSSAMALAHGNDSAKARASGCHGLRGKRLICQAMRKDPP